MPGNDHRVKGTVRRRAAFAVGAIALVLALVIVQPLWLPHGLARAFPGIVWQVDTDQPIVALTFDDGPDPIYTPQVLELLERYNVHATFFLIGKHARQYPELVARIRANGHEIGNHTDTKARRFTCRPNRLRGAWFARKRRWEFPAQQELLAGKCNRDRA